MTKILNKFVRRYTNLSSALCILKNKKLTLLSPESWPDKNDRFFIDLYCNNVKNIHALCFTQAVETFHHWAVFASGIDGICIEFNREILENYIKSSQKDIKFQSVYYARIKDINENKFCFEDIPYLKRIGYSDEHEWRIIYICDRENPEILPSFPIGLDAINCIYFNPSMPKNLSDNLKCIMKEITEIGNLKIASSTLTNSLQWKSSGKEFFKRSIK